MDTVTTPGLTRCQHCHLNHTDPCDDSRKLECLIYQAQQKLASMQAAQNNPTATPGAPTIDTPTAPAPAAPVNMGDLHAALGVPQAPQAPAPASFIPQAPAPHPTAVPAASASVSDNINPNHYTRFKIQPIQFARENELMFWQANVIKYVVRADAKNGVEDIEKAIDFLMKERAFIKGDPKWMDVRWVAPEDSVK